MCGRWGLGTGSGTALSLSPASLSHLCWADSFCGKSLTVKALGPDNPSADDSLATPRESKEQQEKGRFFFFFPALAVELNCWATPSMHFKFLWSFI